MPKEWEKILLKRKWKPKKDQGITELEPSTVETPSEVVVPETDVRFTTEYTVYHDQPTSQTEKGSRHQLAVPDTHAPLNQTTNQQSHTPRDHIERSGSRDSLKNLRQTSKLEVSTTRGQLIAFEGGPSALERNTEADKKNATDSVREVPQADEISADDEEFIERTDSPPIEGQEKPSDEGGVETSSPEHKTLKSRYMELDEHRERILGELQQYKTSNEELQQSKHKAESKIGQLNESVDTLGELLKNANAKIQRLVTQNKDLSAQLTQWFESHDIAADAHFESEWKRLDTKIEDWAYHNFNPESSSGITNPLKSTKKIHEYFRHVASDPKRYLKSTKRPIFAQSFVWSFLVGRVFTPLGGGDGDSIRGLYWSESLREELDYILNYFYPDPAGREVSKEWEIEMRKYMKWKASTTRYLLRKINTDSERETRVYDELITSLADKILLYLQPWMTSNDDVSCQKNLCQILLIAVKLDGEINHQLAHLVPQYTWSGSRTSNLHDFEFDSRIMTIMNVSEKESDLDQHARVQMVIRPALVRHGSIDGREYGNFMNPVVVLPAVVHLHSSSGFPPAKLLKNPAGDLDYDSSRYGQYTLSKKGPGGLRHR